MSRRQKAVPRETPPDAKYGSQEVTRFVNVLMLDGHAEPLPVSIDDLDRAPFPYGSLWTVYDEDVTELATMSQ